MAKKKRKGANGVGEYVSINFDISDPQEAAALAAAQLLASKHGRRKAALVAFLAAVYEVYQDTGKLLSPVEIANAIEGNSAPRAMGFTPAVAASRQLDTPPARRRSAASEADTAPTITVSKAAKATSAQVAANFASGLGGFFD